MSFVLLIVLALVHIVASRLRFLHVLPRSIWLSVAGGASVSYVFLYLIPELVEAREAVTIAGHHLSVFFISLAGLCFIYGLEKVAKTRDTENEDLVFWIHMGSYGVYNFIIGYILIAQSLGTNDIQILFFLAMVLHFLVNDYALLKHHKNRYLRIGRWSLAVAVVLGGVLAALWTVPNHILFGGIAFISGGIIMNTLKEELPEERESKYWAFILGVIAYSAILFFMHQA